jgi:hypothetical protein
MRKKIFMHPGQQYFLSHPAKMKVGVCGRGYGKTKIIAMESYSCVNNLPRSRGFLLAQTYTQAITKFLPQILDFWHEMGMVEDKPNRPGHYVVGKKPPPYFAEPLLKMKKYENTVTVFNGSCIEILSMDRPNLNLGGSYDWGAADEIQGINKDKFNKEYAVMIRGNIHRYNHPKHQTLILTGTMPWLSSGQWVLDYAELAKEDPKNVLYLERPSFDNILVLGKEYFERQKKILPAMIYEIEIKNKRANIFASGFYPDFSEQNHTYYASYNYAAATLSISDLSSFAPKATDYNPELALDISFDFGARVTCMIIAQEYNGELKIFDTFYAKSSEATLNVDDDSQRPLQRVLSSFLRAYQSHKNIINIWGDHTGHSKSDRALSSYDIVERIFRQNKVLYANKVERTNNPSHTKKYHAINDILGGRVAKCPKIKINMNNCKDLIVSIQLSPVNNDYSKNKNSERDDNLGIEKQTHLSDAFDYLIFNKYKNIAGISTYGSENVSINIGSIV